MMLSFRVFCFVRDPFSNRSTPGGDGLRTCQSSARRSRATALDSDNAASRARARLQPPGLPSPADPDALRSSLSVSIGVEAVTVAENDSANSALGRVGQTAARAELPGVRLFKTGKILKPRGGSFQPKMKTVRRVQGN